MTWQDQAACKGKPLGDYFRAKARTPQSVKSLCAGCPVREACALQGMRQEEFGIWGGMSKTQRDRVARRVLLPAALRMADGWLVSTWFRDKNGDWHALGFLAETSESLPGTVGAALRIARSLHDWRPQDLQEPTEAAA